MQLSFSLIDTRSKLFSVSHLMHYLMLIVVVCMGCFVAGGDLANMTIPRYCIQKERRALLSFRENLVDTKSTLYDWWDGEGKTDCCTWAGVNCSSHTGHVIRLDLSTYSYGLAGNFSSSLQLLDQLQYLDLSGIDFQSNHVPNFLASLTNLRHLNISAANLTGPIPHQLANLSNLLHLDLSYNFLGGSIPFAFANMTSLTHLNLSGNQLQGVIPKSFGNSSSLIELNLSKNLFHGLLPYFDRCSSLSYLSLGQKFLNGSIPDFTRCGSLQKLDLSGNQLGGIIPKSLSNCSSLVELNLSENLLKGLLPNFVGCSSLSNLSLGHDSLNGSNIPGCSSLRKLDLSRNQLVGVIPKSFEHCSSLVELNLSKNLLNGSLPNFFGCSSLISLSLGHNSLNGSIPELAGCKSLRKLDLSGNWLSGKLPNSVGQVSSLEYLDVSSNSLEGVISDVHFLKLAQLTYLDLSFNSFAFELSTDDDGGINSNLMTIKLQSCQLGPSFPAWLQTQRYFTHLDISNTGISDRFPAWFWDQLPQGLKFLNVSSNEINGMVPDIVATFEENPAMDLSYNHLEGRVPLLPYELAAINLSGNRFSGNLSFLCQRDEALTLLTFLDLSNNSLSGSLPDCWLKFQARLVVLNLSNNNLSGELPSSLGYLSQLEALYLRTNAFVGELPISLSDCIKLRFLDLGENKLSGIIPAWIGERLSNLSFLVLRSNRFYGSLPSQVCWLNNLQLLDLSKNRISGNIPRCFGNFTTMALRRFGDDVTTHQYSSYIRFSCRKSKVRPDYPDSNALDCDVISTDVAIFIDNALVAWKGTKREFGRGLELLKSIDLSSNKLSGKLPYEITSLHELVSLNLSMNKLHGELPKNMAPLTNLEILDLSRNGFSGNIPTSLSQLTFLNNLDLSNNNFLGRIPTGSQLQLFNSSSYAGNPRLCGPPLTPRCRLPPPTVVVPKEDDEDEGDIWKSYYIGMGVGFVVGFWGICGTIFLNRQCRYFLFASLSLVKDWIYVIVVVHFRTLQRKFGRF